jgi:hypothetical protein
VTTPSDVEIVNPLEWPVGQPRTETHRRKPALFGRSGRGVHLLDGIDDVSQQLRMLGATNVVVTYNRKIKDATNDPGAAAYFELLKLGQHVFACDRWDRTGDNFRAIALHVEAMRGMDRWGVGDVRARFAGYKALAAVGADVPWWRVLGFEQRPTRDQAESKYRELMRQHHPDRGGNSNQAAEITAAWAEARKELGI